MLSSILNTKTAIEINRGIMRAFVAMRQMLLYSPHTEASDLRQEVKELKAYMDEVFADQNDINEDARMQIELINQVLAELQAVKKIQEKKKRPPIGFLRPED